MRLSLVLKKIYHNPPAPRPTGQARVLLAIYFLNCETEESFHIFIGLLFCVF